MTSVPTAAPTANLSPFDLVSEVPALEYLEGFTAFWHPPETADAGGRGVVEITNDRHVVVLDAHADTVFEARKWLGEVDWSRLADEAKAELMGDE